MAEANARALTVEEAKARILDGISPLVETDAVDLFTANRRVLAAPLRALLTQPPFTASAMDGYAVKAADAGILPRALTVIGEAAAGRAYTGPLKAGEAVRIFTGAPVPEGCEAIVIQENTRREGSKVTILDGRPDAEHIRPAGGDFVGGQALIAAGRLLTPRDVTLAAAGGHSLLRVRRRPRVAILATGDELVMPGETPKQDQIVCSNPFGVAAIVHEAGGEARFLGIARDTRSSLADHLERVGDADILVTLGGASVGDHDLVGPVLAERGMALAFWKIAMRPGKPLMFGTLGTTRVLGLPGNPVSALVTARLFLVPLVRALLGLEPEPDQATTGRLTVPLGANGPRAHYMRATATVETDGLAVTPVRSQDSSLLTPFAAADVLIVRPIGAGALAAGARVPVLRLDF